ncbi:hypothetical protein Tco_0994614, partial [Tanacetum coccineum]
MYGSQDEIPPPPPPPPSSPQTPTQQTHHIVSTIKLPILKKGEYDIWAMKMEHYLAHTDYPIWEVIQNGNGPVSITTDTQGQIKVLPPKTAKEIVARERERKARTTLLMALPEDHLAKFHKMTDEKEMWDAIKSRFGGNDESKKMHKYILKQQFEGFSVSNSKGLHKGYDRFQSLLRVDSLSFDDLYNNLRVFENDVKGSTASSSSSQNVAFVSENTSSTNDLDEYDLEEMDLKWQVAMISMRMKKFYKKTGHFARECRIKREQLSDASIEIKAYSQGLKKVEAQLVAHQQGQLWYEQKIKFMKIDLDDKTDVLTYHKKLLVEAQKEKEDLKAKVEKWHNSSKNLSKLLNTQMSANDKFGLGYGDHRYDGILSYENEVLQSVFMNKESELEKQPLYDRFVTAGGMHAVPPPMTGNYMPSGPDIEVDYSQFTYVSEPVVNESNVECKPKVWSDATIIEEYESDSKDEYVSIPTKQQETPSFANHLNHLIRDCDFHEKRMARKAELNNGWNRKSINTARASSTKNVSTARQTFNRQSVLTSTAMKVNTVKPIMNRLVLLRGKGKLLLSPQQVVIRDHKDITGTMSPNTMVDPVLEIDYPHRALKNKGIVDSGCSRHMTGNKAYLAEFQDFNGGPVAFGGRDSEKVDESAQDCFVLLIWSSYSSTITPDLKTDANREGPREEEHVFLDELERLKRQGKDANKAAEALRKEFAQEIENLIIQEGATKASSTNIFSTVSTPAKASSTNLVNTVS